MDLVSNQRSQSQWQHGIVVNRGCGDRHCILSSPHPASLLSNLLSQCEPGILVNRGCGDRHCILSNPPPESLFTNLIYCSVLARAGSGQWAFAHRSLAHLLLLNSNEQL